MDERDRRGTDALHAWRVRMLATTLRIILALGSLVGIPSIAFAVVVGEPLIAIADVAGLVVLAFITFRERLSYRTRAITLLAMTYLLGLVLLLSVGVVAQLYLLAFPVFAAVLLGLRPAFVALGTNAVTLVAAGMLDVFDIPIAIAGLAEPFEWGLVVLNFMFVNTVIAVFSAVLLGRLERSLEDEQEISASLEHQRADLRAINRDLEREVEERRRAEAALQRLAVAMAQARDVIAITDADGRIDYGNDAYDRLLEQAASPPDSGRLVDLWPEGPQREEVAQALRDAATWSGPLAFRAQPTTELEFDARIAPVTSPDGEVVASVAVLRDVTSERRMEARLRRAEKLEALGTLAAGTAHDFNNVLASILAVAEMTDARSDDATVQHSMQLIVRACDRARDVVRRMMVFGRRSDLGIQPTSVTELVEGSLALLRAALPANVRIQTHLEADATVMARASDLDQVVTNLATNAAHAMGDDPGATLSFTTRMVGRDEVAVEAHPLLDPGRRYVELSVTDTGEGIPPAHLDDIFDPFFTTKDHAEGSGLGLASVHAIVTSLDGDIAVVSTQGSGTIFRILLPIAEGEQAAPQRDAQGADTVAAGARVLFVDDEEVLRTVTKQALAQRGFVVHSAEDGSAALRRFDADPSAIDVVVTDMSMPGLDGAELIRRLRERRPGLPAILCSGYVETAGLAATEVSAYLAKPYTIDELVARIRDALEGTAPTSR